MKLNSFLPQNKYEVGNLVQLSHYPFEELEPYLMGIMNGKGYEWKYFPMQMTGVAPEYQDNSSFHKEIVRILMNPTQAEIACDVYYLAKLVLE